MKDELKHKLNKKADKIELLERYSKFLEEHGYTDTDWWQEKPTAIESFIEEEGLEANTESSVVNPFEEPKFYGGNPNIGHEGYDGIKFDSFHEDEAPKVSKEAWNEAYPKIGRHCDEAGQSEFYAKGLHLDKTINLSGNTYSFNEEKGYVYRKDIEGNVTRLDDENLIKYLKYRISVLENAEDTIDFNTTEADDE